jgi:hypothetical protein
MENKATLQLEAQIDKNQYEESQLISIKIPASYLSYYTNSRFFERVDGEIDLGCVRYSFVKRRLFNDSLEFLCIPNFSVTELQAAKMEFFKTINDLQQNIHDKKPGSHSNSSKTFSSDIYTICEPINLLALSDSNLAKFSYFSPSRTFYFPPIIENPPEAC